VSAGRVRKLETFGHPVEVAVPGQRVACNLVLKDNHQVVRGNVVLTANVQPVKNLFVSIEDKPRLISGKLSDRLSDQPIRLYHGTAECHGFIRWVQEIGSESIGIGMINLLDPVLAQPQDRFVVRLTDETIYGGTVLLSEKQRWLKREMLPELAGQLMTKDFSAAIKTYIKSAPNKIVNTKQLASFTPAASLGLLQEMLKSGDVVKLDENVTVPEMRVELSARLNKAAAQLLVGAEEDGTSLEALRSKLSPKLDRATFQALVDEDVASGKLIRKGDKILLPGLEKPKTIDSAMSGLQEKIVAATDSNFCLDVTDLTGLCGADANKIKQAAQMLAKDGRTNFIAHEFVISDQNLLRAHTVLEKIWNAKRNIAPGDFREELNTTRKYAMALLQHFDDQKITRRLQNGRVLLKPVPKN
jgi:selenocysteine-specific elongation factor